MRESGFSPTAKSTAGSCASPTAGEINVPVNLEAERSILGSVLIDSALVEDLIASGLHPVDFSLDTHQRIYQRILDLVQHSRPIDEISIAEELTAHGELEQVGGYAYLSELINLVVPERKHVLYHVAIVRTKAKLRKIQRIGERAHVAAGLAGADPERIGRDLVGEMEAVLSKPMS